MTFRMTTRTLCKLASVAIFMAVCLTSGMSRAEDTSPAPAKPGAFEILAPGGQGGWLNVDNQLTINDLKGRFVLLDFWTYGCVNCMQVVPELDALEKKFGDKLFVIGVHSAKFSGEKDAYRILDAARRFGLNHPVVQDSDYAIWKHFGVKAWPTLVLLDPEGNEISRYSGEGHQADLERDLTTRVAAVKAPPTPAPVISHNKKEEFAVWYPARLALSKSLIYVADSGHNRIMGFDKAGDIKLKIGSQEQGFADGAFDKASFNNPRGLVVVGSKIYVADTGNHALREIDLTTKHVTTIAGTGARGYVYKADNLPAKGVALASPWDVDVMPDGKTLVIAMAGLHQLWTYDISTKTLSVLAGTGHEKLTDGPAMEADLAQPSGVSVRNGVVYFVDAESSAVRKLENGQIKTLIGTGLFDFGDVDGTYPQAMVQHPQGLFADKDKIWIADTYNFLIKSYDLTTGELRRYPVESGITLYEPGDIVVQGQTAFIANTNGHQIVKVDLESGVATALPLKPDVPSGSTIR